jgi:ubiquitin carboxyl-terminal hydrolase 8
MSQPEVYKDKGLSGLTNLGNTCFMNSTLQCLSHCYELNDFLTEGKFKKKLNKKAESLILLEWNKLRELLWSENCIISPGGFLSSVQKVAKIKDKTIFTGFAQNDLTEFLVFIIDCFHTAISREVNMTITGDAQNETDKLAKKCFEMKKNMYKKEYSEFLNLFYGTHVSKIETENGDYLNASPEPFLLLDLSLPKETQKNNKPCTLTECLEDYTSVEVLDGDNMVLNEKTGKKEVAKKQVVFWSLPEIFIITLKRFSNSVKKNQALVHFPLENLDMSPYVVGYDRFSYVYDLCGICNHSGGVFGGHYTSFVKNANGKWYHFNDSSVDEITDLNKLISPKSYCFFYRKKK